MLKQGSMSFEEYYNLFAQKEEKSWMEYASFIDAMKRNINYATQTSALNWQKINGSDPVTFHNHVEMWSQTDSNLEQIKHQLPRQTGNSTTSTFTPLLPNRRQTITTFLLGKASTSSIKASTPTYLSTFSTGYQ